MSNTLFSPVGKSSSCPNTHVQKLLDVPDVNPTAQKMNGNRMPKNMGV
jgi:hypothetical protein